ncbi:hypothetical protein [Streptomyces sp. NPDC019224]|uniref:hypothetical protein n=1 Tax=Streptomyces sp. NPDC019224 TaxID=3154484 RepID=UPI00340A2A67
MSVLFVEESSGRSQLFDFAELPVSEELQRWLAGCVAGEVSARSTVKRVGTMQNLYFVARSFALVLAESPGPVAHPRDVTADHFTAFRARHAHLKSMGNYVAALRRLLRADTALSESARAGLAAIRVRKTAQEPGELEYTDTEWQEILTAVRRDVRVARDRIRYGRAVLARFRAGQLAAGSDEEKLGRLLDVFDRTGALPRYSGGSQTAAVIEAGGATYVTSLLCLSLDEMTAFALLLVALTGQNFGTVASWPVAHFRPDGGLTDKGLALLESVKPRRGPEREHMVVPLEDVLTGADDEHRLFRSPLRVYLLLLELGETARRLGGLTTVFAGHILNPRAGGTQWPSTLRAHHVARWASERGFPVAESAVAGGRPAVSVRRLRRTVIERRRRPVAQSTRTMREIYLMPSKSVRAESEQIVATALQKEVDKARRQQAVPVFTPDFVRLAGEDLSAAAQTAGMEPQRLKLLLAGDQDTPLASCVDHTASPHAAAGQPCTASFLACLDCENARALPHQLPVQIAAIEEMYALRPHLDPALWGARYEPRVQQLEEISRAFDPAERERAKDAITDGQRQLVRNLLEGRWDLC